MSEFRTLHVGLGTIGMKILRAGMETGICRPVAAVDPAPSMAGRSLGDVAEMPDLAGVRVFGDLDEAISEVGGAGCADIMVHCAGSRLPDIALSLFTAVAHRMNVVSTAEELAWPWLRHPSLAAELARAAERHGVTVVGTGINPGFLLDALPILLCRPCLHIRGVRAERIVNVSLRRPQLQEKVGSGLDPAAFRSLAEQGRIGHVGLGESAALLAAGLGWDTSYLDESIEPVVADEPTGTSYVQIAAGQVKGCHQSAVVQTHDGRWIELTCRMVHGEPDPHDGIEVDADPPVRMRIDGGIFGDTATVGCAINVLRQTVMARPGLLSVKDLPLA